jgi:hypothetical protein
MVRNRAATSGSLLTHAAGQQVVVAGQVFGGTVEHDIGTQGQGLLEIRGQEGVVHDDQQAVFVGQGAEGFQVRDFHGGVGGRLQVDGLCVGLDGLFYGIQIAGVDRREGHPIGFIGLFEQPERSAVQIKAGHDVVTGSEQAHDSIDGSHAGGKAQGIDTGFQRGKDFFQAGMGGIGFTGVGPAGGLAQAGVGKSGCEIQRRGNGTGGIVGAAPVDTGSGEFHDRVPPYRCMAAPKLYQYNRQSIPLYNTVSRGHLSRAEKGLETGKSPVTGFLFIRPVI